jgi:hypothetical protein
MARLTAKARSKIPAKDFAGKGRSFPVEDKTRARAALMLINKAPASERAHIRARSEAKLHHADSRRDLGRHPLKD